MNRKIEMYNLHAHGEKARGYKSAALLAIDGLRKASMWLAENGYKLDAEYLDRQCSKIDESSCLRVIALNLDHRLQSSIEASEKAEAEARKETDGT